MATIVDSTDVDDLLTELMGDDVPTVPVVTPITHCSGHNCHQPITPDDLTRSIKHRHTSSILCPQCMKRLGVNRLKKIDHKSTELHSPWDWAWVSDGKRLATRTEKVKK